jgi:hypothetical protein
MRSESLSIFHCETYNSCSAAQIYLLKKTFSRRGTGFQKAGKKVTMDGTTKSRWIELCAEVAICDSVQRLQELMEEINVMLSAEEQRLGKTGDAEIPKRTSGAAPAVLTRKRRHYEGIY